MAMTLKQFARFCAFMEYPFDDTVEVLVDRGMTRDAAEALTRDSNREYREQEAAEGRDLDRLAIEEEWRA